MRLEPSKASDQSMISVWPRRYWRHALAAVGVLLALGYGAVANAQTCMGVAATRVGTNNPETIVGTEGRDVIQARRGNDIVYGLGGDDLVCSGLGDDTVYGGYGDQTNPQMVPSGNDTLNGGDNNDNLSGEDGDDTLIGSCPCPPTGVNDVCDGGTGTDTARNCERKISIP